MTTLRICITGHRWNKIDRALRPQLEASLREAFGTLASREARTTLVCGMAEGTDLVAASVRPREWALEAVLPLPAPTWRRHLAATSDLGDAEEFDRLLPGASVVVLPHRSGPDYAALARYLAETSQVLVAVWDGLAPKPGGTGEVIALARARGARVIVLPTPRA